MRRSGWSGYNDDAPSSEEGIAFSSRGRGRVGFDVACFVVPRTTGRRLGVAETESVSLAYFVPTRCWSDGRTETDQSAADLDFDFAVLFLFPGVYRYALSDKWTSPSARSSAIHLTFTRSQCADRRRRHDALRTIG